MNVEKVVTIQFLYQQLQLSHFETICYMVDFLISGHILQMRNTMTLLS